MHNYRIFSMKNLVLIMFFCLIIGCSGKSDKHYNKMGLIYLSNGHYDDAIGAFRKAVMRNPSDAETHFNLGRAYKRKGMDEKAKAEFSISYRIAPKKFDRYVKEYGEKVNYEFTDAQYLSELATVYMEKGMLDEAIDTFKNVLDMQPGNFRVHYDLGMIYSRKRMYDEAISEFKSATEIHPNMPEAHYNLGLVYYKQGMFDMAISEYKSTLSLFTESKSRKRAGVHYKLGLAYNDKAMKEDAIKQLNKALEITPNDGKIHYKLSNIYKESGMLEQAERELDIYEKLKKQK